MMGPMLDSVADAFLRLVAEGRTYVLLLPVYAALLIGERVAHGLLTRRPWDNRDAAANVSITVAYLGVDVLFGKILPVGLMAWLFDHARLVDLPVGAAGWLLAFLLHDFIWYVDHRMGHRVGFLWALHHVHHSSEEYNTTVASRGFIFDNVLARPLFFLLPIFGVSAFQFIVIRIVVSIFGIAQHTRLVPKMPWLDRVLATPSSHRVHHGSNDKYIDRNYGEVLMLWDHLFGTYQPEEEEPDFGVTDPIRTYHPIKIQLAGLRWLAHRVASADRLSDKLRYLVKPPEWDHRARIPSKTRLTSASTA
jgi:sterol desaturase/sphingolipid hydroxylase (fatty acid hydroxylase superfamily)